MAKVFAEEFVSQVHPRLVKNDERRTAIEFFLDSTEEVEQHRHRGIATPVSVFHQVLHLENHQTALAQSILICVEKATERTAQGVRFQRRTHVFVLNSCDKIGHCSALRMPQQVDSVCDCIFLCRSYAQAAKTTQFFDPR